MYSNIAFITGQGPHSIGNSHLGKVIMCDTTSGAPVVLELDSTANAGCVRVVRTDENSGNGASYVKVTVSSGLISNFSYFVLPVENDWAEFICDGQGKWRVIGMGQAPVKGVGGQHRTVLSTQFSNKLYQCHMGDRGAVIRVVTGLTGEQNPPNPHGAMQIVLPSNSDIHAMRAQSYASTWRVGVMMTEAEESSYVWVVSASTTIMGQSGFTIDEPNKIYWFDFDSGQWFADAGAGA